MTLFVFFENHLHKLRRRKGEVSERVGGVRNEKSRATNTSPFFSTMTRFPTSCFVTFPDILPQPAACRWKYFFVNQVRSNTGGVLFSLLFTSRKCLPLPLPPPSFAIGSARYACVAATPWRLTTRATVFPARVVATAMLSYYDVFFPLFFS